MGTQRYGPFSVVGGEVPTGIDVQSGDRIETSSSGFVDFGGAVFGMGAPILPADGDHWLTPQDYPAPHLRKNSLIFRIGTGPWHQGGTAATVTIPPNESGELVLRANDRDVTDNSRGWQVTLVITRPDPPISASPRLRIRHIEVVQCVQRWDNTIRLVRGKSTMVRVFVDSGIAAPQGNVTGLLTINDVDIGADIASSIAPEAPITAPPPDQPPDRNQRSASLNFFLPSGMTFSANVRYIARVFVVGHQNDPTPGWAATGDVQVQFRLQPTQNILPILVADGANNLPAPSFDVFRRTLRSGALPRFPVADQGFIIAGPGMPYTTTYPLHTWVGWGRLFGELRVITTLAGRAGIWVAMVPQNDHPNISSGLGEPRNVTAPIVQVTANDLEGLAHEMGHAFGLQHARRTGEECDFFNGGCDSRLPGNGRTDEVGFNVDPDIAGVRRVIPVGSDEIMSYGQDQQWPSVATYNILFDGVPRQ